MSGQNYAATSYDPIRANPKDAEDMRRWLQGELDKISDVINSMDRAIVSLEGRIADLEP